MLKYILSLVLAVSAVAETYDMQKIPNPTGSSCLGGYVVNTPGGLNNHGDVAGTSQYCPSILTMRDAPYYYHNGNILLLRYLPGDPYGQGYGINDNGLVVGRYGGRPFFFNGNTGDFTLFGFLGDFQDVNNNGIAVGFNNYATCYFGNCPPIGPIYRTLNGTIYPIPLLPDCSTGIATSINELNYVVGYQVNSSGQKKGFIYHIESETLIPLEPNLNMLPTDINNLGHITGYFMEGGSFYWADSDWQGVPMTRAYAVSDGDRVVGELEGRAMIWDQSQGGRDLNDLVLKPEYTLLSAKDINEEGQILVQASNRESFILTKNE